MWLYPVFEWFANDPVGRTVAWVTGGLAAFWAFITLRDRRIRKEEKVRSELEARKAKDQAIEKLEEQSNERLEKAERARASVPDADILDSMSDEEYEFLFGRQRGD